MKKEKVWGETGSGVVGKHAQQKQNAKPDMRKIYRNNV